MDIIFGNTKKQTAQRMRKFKQKGVLDFFEATPKMPKLAVLLAPGPEGVPFLSDIPEHVHIVGVNKAGAMIQINDWVVSDSNCCKKPWFRGVDQRLKFLGPPKFRHTTTCRRIFSMTAAKRTPSFKYPGKNTHYVFNMASADYTGPAEKKLRKGGTVAASALWVMYYCGVKTAVLCGVDMSGNLYYDGSANPDKYYVGKHGDTWASTNALNRVIRWMQTAGGMEVFTLSPSKLNLAQVTEEVFE